MTSVSDLTARRDSRTQAMASHPATLSKQCPPHAALLHRIAAVITEEGLPPAKLTVNVTPTGATVEIDATGDELVENVVRRYAAAFGLPPVIEAPYDAPGGYAATLWSTSSYDGTGCWISVRGYELVPT